MAIAVTWVQYNPSDLSTLQPDITYLDLQTYQTGQWGASSSEKRRFLLGLRFQGCAAQNIKVWMDGTLGDIYLADDDEPELRVDLTSKSFVFKTIFLDPTAANYAALVTSAETGNPGTDSNWITMPSTDTAALNLNSATLTPNLWANSNLFGFAMQAGTIDNSSAAANIRNFRLLASFDTTDG